MKESEIEKGLHITISNDPVNTERTHTVNDEMYKMRGKPYIINDVISTGHGPTAVIGSYYWHPKDLVENQPVKKSQLFHFDMRRLVI